MKIELTRQEIIDLIFEKKVVGEEFEISTKDSCLSILAELDMRLKDGKIFNRKASVVCGQTLPAKDVYRRRSSYETAQ